jgi:tRNA-dihydrouridine synthase
MRLTGADGVMLGRGAVANPWLFEEVLAAFEGRPYERPRPEEKVLLLRELRDRVLSFFGEAMGVPFSRAYAGPLLSGMPGAREARAAYMTARTAGDQDRVFDALLQRLRAPLAEAAA